LIELPWTGKSRSVHISIFYSAEAVHRTLIPNFHPAENVHRNGLNAAICYSDNIENYHVYRHLRLRENSRRFRPPDENGAENDSPKTSTASRQPNRCECDQTLWKCRRIRPPYRRLCPPNQPKPATAPPIPPTG
jgi:hypothetical protein